MVLVYVAGEMLELTVRMVSGTFGLVWWAVGGKTTEEKHHDELMAEMRRMNSRLVELEQSLHDKDPPAGGGGEQLALGFGDPDARQIHESK